LLALTLSPLALLFPPYTDVAEIVEERVKRGIAVLRDDKGEKIPPKLGDREF
jgi:hypothetical protein